MKKQGNNTDKLIYLGMIVGAVIGLIAYTQHWIS